MADDGLQTGLATTYCKHCGNMVSARRLGQSLRFMVGDHSRNGQVPPMRCQGSLAILLENELVPKTPPDPCQKSPNHYSEEDLDFYYQQLSGDCWC